MKKLPKKAILLIQAMKSKSVAKINAIITFPTSVKIHSVCFTVTGSFLIIIHLFGSLLDSAREIQTAKQMNGNHLGHKEEREEERGWIDGKGGRERERERERERQREAEREREKREGGRERDREKKRDRETEEDLARINSRG